ncbi:3-oxoacyl-(acyl-carrier-protein) synthase III [Pirellula staleyi DSM 6068]|uniref:Beta-ketoacyl-[acyl-carrier-protein] synthase III n=1 Tax=Pirellula staleyi (strain ATCC 27377 / DSM 6068 / ICPB 4128) TaxID=530564 RepID=D2R8U5_PIRSD|nr:3-oxoacyl-(acyl-carrier-protein) synthase III [Pirellula staleyi DSM 6068]
MPQSEVAPRNWFFPITGVAVRAMGAYVPPRIVPNEELSSLGCDADWIVQRTGIHERRRADDAVATSDLGAMAARVCLDRAGISARDLDLIVLATMTPDSPSPSTACHVQRLLGSSAASMDVSAACAGFMFALVTGMQFVKTGASQNVLVVGSDLMTRTVHPKDVKTFPLFGDGAAAVLLGPASESQGFLSVTLGSQGEGAPLLQIPAGGSREPLTAQAIEEGRQYLAMDGRAVFKWAVRQVADSCREAAARAGVTLADIDHLVLHQANLRIMDAVARELGIPMSKVAVNVDRYGNTSAASIPLALEELAQSGKLQPGHRVLMSGFGAGLAWGTGLFVW